jgi:tetratricopeptide (TPR) repeat protein
LPFYILVPVLAYALWYGLQPATVIAPFHLPQENKEHPLPFSGEAVADALQDAIISTEQEAKGERPNLSCYFGPPKGGPSAYWEPAYLGGLRAEAGNSFAVRGPVAVEVKGISLDAIISAAREILGKERYITGDVIVSGGNGFRLIAQANDSGPWATDPKELSFDGLRYASCELAERILGATNKNVLAAAWIRRGKYKYDDVIKLYRDLPTKGGDPGAVNNLGVVLRLKCTAAGGAASSKPQQKCIEDAIARFQQAIAIRWRFPEAHSNLGSALRYRGEIDKAIAEYREAIKLEPTYAAAHYNLGNSLMDKNRVDEAIAEYRRAIDLKPDYASAHNNLAEALLLDQGHTDEAIAEARRAVDLVPSASHYSILAKALNQKGQYDEAIAECNQAIAQDQSLAEAYLFWGVALQKKGQTDDAIAKYRRAMDGFDQTLAVNPLDTEAHRYLAEAHLYLGVALQKKGQTDDAIGEYRRAIDGFDQTFAVNPLDTEAHRYLTMARNDLEEAKKQASSESPLH